MSTKPPEKPTSFDSQTNSVDTAEFLYWDGSFSTTSLDGAAIIISETLNQPLIYDPSKYVMSVDNITIDSTRFSTFVATPYQAIAPFPPPTSIDQLNYYVQFRWGVTTSSAFVYMVTTNPNQPPQPTYPINNANYQTYYGVYTIQQFLDMVNAALAACYVILLAQLGGTYPDQANTPPVLQMSAESGILAFIVPESMITNGVTIVLEDELNDVLNLPHTLLIENNPIAPSPNNAFLIDPSSSSYKTVRASIDFLTPTTTLTGNSFWTGTCIYICTAYDFRAAWYNVFQLVLISNLAALEQVSTPSSRTTIQSVKKQILASFPLNLNGADRIQGQLLYTPTIRRWLEIGLNSNVNTIRIEFQYTDRMGNFYPLLQNWGRIASVRILFKKKNSKIADKLAEEYHLANQKRSLEENESFEDSRRKRKKK